MPALPADPARGGRSRARRGSGVVGFAPVRQKQRGDQADGGQAHQNEHGASQPAQAAAEQPAHSVEGPDAVDAPVQPANNDEQQQDLSK